jgi:hypothetical protein
MWRGMSRYPHILGGRTIVVAGGRPGAKFVAYPVEDPAAEGGPTLMNWVLEIRGPRPEGGIGGSHRPVAVGEALVSDGGPRPAAALELRPGDAGR